MKDEDCKLLDHRGGEVLNMICIYNLEQTMAVTMMDLFCEIISLRPCSTLTPNNLFYCMGRMTFQKGWSHPLLMFTLELPLSKQGNPLVNPPCLLCYLEIALKPHTMANITNWTKSSSRRTQPQATSANLACTYEFCNASQMAARYIALILNEHSNPSSLHQLQ